MSKMVKSLKAIANSDEAVDSLDNSINFYTLEGRCKKCNVGDYTLIVYDFIHNKSDQKESIFRTQCMCCSSKDIYYAKQVSLN